MKSEDLFRQWQELNKKRTRVSPTSLRQSTTDEDSEAELDVPVSLDGAEWAGALLQRLTQLEERVAKW